MKLVYTELIVFKSGEIMLLQKRLMLRNTVSLVFMLKTMRTMGFGLQKSG
jgi:hypothetical protein